MNVANILFILSLWFCVYTVLLYPLLLAFLARGPVTKAPSGVPPMSVSIILAVRNGEQWIEDKLDCLLALDYPKDMVQLIVVSDGSDDRTDEIARRYVITHGIHFLRISRSGKAAALNAALRSATGEILFFTDVRQKLTPNSLRDLVARFAESNVGVVSGELVILDSASGKTTDVGLYWRYEKWMRKRLSEIDSTFGATGCIYAMRRELAHPLPPETLNDDMYLPLLAFFAGYRVVFEERARAYDFSASARVEFQRKVRTLAGVFQIIRFFPALLGRGNRMWFHFLSHKVARLLLPYALVVLGVTSFFLPQPIRIPALGVQAGFYLAGSMNCWIPQRNPLKRLSSPANAFLLLMLAALSAVKILFVRPRVLWKETHVHP